MTFGKSTKPLGLLSKCTRFQMAVWRQAPEIRVRKVNKNTAHTEYWGKMMAVLSVVNPVALTSPRPNFEKSLNNYRYKTEGLLLHFSIIQKLFKT